MWPIVQPRFDPQALLDAVDAQRRARGLTWSQLSAELHVSTTTIRGMPKRRWGIELDGVIGLAHWCGRTVESFAGADGGPPPAATGQRRAPPFLRFDTAALYAAVNDERERRGLTWAQVATEVWPSGPWDEAQLRQMAKGGRSDVYRALAICGWLGRTIQSFTHETMFQGFL
jgi:transcriptional regulator with XRE-family HTH domain